MSVRLYVIASIALSVIDFFFSNSWAGQVKIKNQVSTTFRRDLVGDGKLRTFRLALACTGEFAQYNLTEQGIPSSATDAQKKEAVLAAMNITLTRVNAIFERDLAVTMQLVANITTLISLNAATDAYTNDDAEKLLDEVTTNFCGPSI